MVMRHFTAKSVNASGGAVGPPTDTSHPIIPPSSTSPTSNHKDNNLRRFAFPSPYKTHRLESNLLPVFADVTKDDMLGYLKSMLTIRRMEMAADALYKARMIKGFCHLSTGQVRRTNAYPFDILTFRKQFQWELRQP